MILYIMTDMEGLSGIDHWDQCYDPDDASPKYLYGRDQLTAEANAAIEGCFDAGATEVRILDGHGRNRNKGFTDQLDPRAKKVWFEQGTPYRLEAFDEQVTATMMIGQHAMAGTFNAFLDHTQIPKELCCYKINGIEAGEMSQLALYAGACGVPLIYASGDIALCEEAKQLYPHMLTTPTKRGTGWATCELFPPDKVRADIRRDVAIAIANCDRTKALKIETPIDIEVEWAYSALADRYDHLPGVRRPHPRRIAWTIDDPRDIFTWPNASWSRFQS